MRQLITWLKNHRCGDFGLGWHQHCDGAWAGTHAKHGFCCAAIMRYGPRIGLRRDRFEQIGQSKNVDIAVVVISTYYEISNYVGWNERRYGVQ